MAGIAKKTKVVFESLPLGGSLNKLFLVNLQRLIFFAVKTGSSGE
jgi:hypothetical protein